MAQKPVLEVVVIHRRKLLNRSVAAVVVGENEPFGRHDLARAAVAEDDDGVLQSRPVEAVNLLGRKLAPLGLHVLDVHFLQVGQQPHALVGIYLACSNKKQ